MCACVCAPAARPQLLRRVRRAASCARPSLRLTWGKGDSNLDLCRGGPLPSGSINQSAKPTLHPRNLRTGRWARVLQAPSLPLPALPAPPPRPRVPRRTSALGWLSPSPPVPCPPCLLPCSVESRDAGVEEEDGVVSVQVRSVDSSGGRPPLGSAATCSSLVQVLARGPPAPLPPSPALSPAQPRIAVAC